MERQDAESQRQKAGRMSAEIRSIYDGVCFYYYPKEKRFEWQEPAKSRTTVAYRKEFEEHFLKQFE